MGSRSHEQRALLTDYENTTAYSQAFYTLFANIRFYWENEQRAPVQEDTATDASPVHTLLITPASAYKDQVTVAANLAIVAAQSGAETILVDTDLREPGLRQRFGLAQSDGLSELLTEQYLPTQRIVDCLQPTFVPGLRLLSAGAHPELSTALMLSARLEAVTNGLSEIAAASERQTGIVMYHSPPVLAGPDASLVGALTEQTVLAVIMGRTTRAQAKQAQEQLQQAHIKLAGVILLHP